MPPSLYINTMCRWQLAYMYKLGPGFWDTLTFNRLCTKAPLLQTWPYREKDGQLLVERLQYFIKEVNNLQTEMKDARDIRKQQQLQELQDQQNRASNTSVSNYTTTIRKRDNTLATQVAKREALRAAQMRAIKTAGANKSTSSGRARDGIPPLTSQLGEWVNTVIATPASLLLLPISPVPDGVLEDIQRAIRYLEEARILGADVIRYSPNSSQLDIQQPVINILDTQKSATPS